MLSLFGWASAALSLAASRSTTSEKPQVAANVPACARTVAIDAVGDAAALFFPGDRPGGEIIAPVLDATPPILKRVVIPRVAHPRRKIRLTVSASDLWSTTRESTALALRRWKQRPRVDGATPVQATRPLPRHRHCD